MNDNSLITVKKRTKKGKHAIARKIKMLREQHILSLENLGLHKLSASHHFASLSVREQMFDMMQRVENCKARFMA